jgi:complement component 1 Q subcomponent-binding protein, mitochondrial
MYDEENVENAQSGGANSKGRRPDNDIAVAPEDSIEDDSYSPNDTAFPARVHVKVTRDGRPGALVIQALAEAGDLLIENVWLFPKSDLADPKTADAEWQRRNLYTGPPFENLDEDLKLLFERYLDERGINMGMALFIPDYIDHKEQKEYLRWLSSKCIFMFCY